MNVVMDDAVEVYVKEQKPSRDLGKYIAKILVFSLNQYALS